MIAGIGCATLGIGSSYITQTTTSARRQVGTAQRSSAQLCSHNFEVRFCHQPSSAPHQRCTCWMTILMLFA
jgi:hypothetical protein